MTLIDPRLAERRRQVQETSIRRKLRRLLGVLAFVAVIGAAAWLVWSPFLDVDRVVVSGVEQTDVADELASVGLVPGTPLLLVDGDAVVEALRADPWVADVVVRRVLPGTVEVEVSERRPVAVVVGSDGPVVAAEDGVVLEVGAPPDLPRVVVPGAVAPTVGEVLRDEATIGAIRFLGQLPEALRARTVVELTDGEVPGERAVRARVDGHVVLLGRPVSMEEKARTLVALLGEALPAGAEINLLAPTRPAVVVPSAEDAGTGDAPAEGGASGG